MDLNNPEEPTMNNSLQKTLIIIGLIFLFNNSTLYAQSVDHTFTYQGQLLDGTTPANGIYEMTIQGYGSLDGDFIWGDLSEHVNVNVEQGIFTIEDVDLGPIAFDGQDLYLEISVRMGGGNPVYEVLSPRQKLTSVPYANKLITGNLGIGITVAEEKIHVKGVSHEKIKIESTTDSASASLILKTSAGSFDDLSLNKYGPTSPASSAGIPLAGVSKLSSGVHSGPLMLQVIKPNTPMYFVTGGALQMTLESDGDLKLEKDLILENKLTAPDSGDADMKAYIFGKINSTGTPVSVASSSGFSSELLVSGAYRITFSASPGANYVVVATAFDSSVPQIITYSTTLNYFDIHIWDLSSSHVDSAFNFVVYNK